jgi:hypothetical protein
VELLAHFCCLPHSSSIKALPWHRHSMSVDGRKVGSGISVIFAQLPICLVACDRVSAAPALDEPARTLDEPAILGGAYL